MATSDRKFPAPLHALPVWKHVRSRSCCGSDGKGGGSSAAGTEAPATRSDNWMMSDRTMLHWMRQVNGAFNLITFDPVGEGVYSMRPGVEPGGKMAPYTSGGTPTATW